MPRPHCGLGSNPAAHGAWLVPFLPLGPSRVPHPHLDSSPPALRPVPGLCPWQGSGPSAAGDGVRDRKRQRRESI